MQKVKLQIFLIIIVKSLKSNNPNMFQLIPMHDKQTGLAGLSWFRVNIAGLRWSSWSLSLAKLKHPDHLKKWPNPL